VVSSVFFFSLFLHPCLVFKALPLAARARRFSMVFSDWSDNFPFPFSLSCFWFSDSEGPLFNTSQLRSFRWSALFPYPLLQSSQETFSPSPAFQRVTERTPSSPIRTPGTAKPPVPACRNPTRCPRASALEQSSLFCIFFRIKKISLPIALSVPVHFSPRRFIGWFQTANLLREFLTFETSERPRVSHCTKVMIPDA